MKIILLLTALTLAGTQDYLNGYNEGWQIGYCCASEKCLLMEINGISTPSSPMPWLSPEDEAIIKDVPKDTAYYWGYDNGFNQAWGRRPSPFTKDPSYYKKNGKIKNTCRYN